MNFHCCQGFTTSSSLILIHLSCCNLLQPVISVMLSHLFFFYQQKTNIIDEGKIPRSTQEVDKRNYPKRNKTKKPKTTENYVLPNQVRKSTTELVLSSMNPLAQAHKLVTKLALIFWSLVPSFSKLNLFLTRHRVQKRHRGAASQILLRFLPTAAPCQAKRVCSTDCEKTQLIPKIDSKRFHNI